MIKITDRNRCSGCTACAVSCPVSAITMKSDNLGFLYPSVDLNRCIDCGKCERVCPFLSKSLPSNHTDFPKAYAIRHRNLDIVKRSRSGGVFTAISDVVMNRGGIVVGAVMIDKYTVGHVVAETAFERDAMCGSKYAQSIMGDVFKKVRDALQAGREVLFSGTPCQVAGLKAFIGKKTNGHLTTVDIICHGVSSPAVWRDYVGYMERLSGSQVKEVLFRDKLVYGWDMHRETVVLSDGSRRPTPFSFYHDAILRPSCNECHLSTLNRVGDITLGDFWNWKNAVPQMNHDNLGLSSVLINSPIGESLFEEVVSLGDLDVCHVETEQIKQPNLCHPTPKHRDAEVFEKTYLRNGYVAALRKTGVIGYRRALRSFKVRLRYRLNKIIRS